MKKKKKKVRAMCSAPTNALWEICKESSHKLHSKEDNRILECFFMVLRKFFHKRLGQDPAKNTCNLNNAFKYLVCFLGH